MKKNTGLRKFEWSDKLLSVGNSEIDHDHMKLLGVYNDLIDLTESEVNRVKFAEILSKMTDYCLRHFKKEEMYMREMSYPQLEQHLRQHRNYIYKVAMYNVDLTGANPPEPQEIITFIEKWWRKHILINDLDFERYKKEINSTAVYSSF